MKLSLMAARRGLAGLEFASGIPGTIGGAIRMNAGAHGKEMKDIVLKTKYMDLDGNLQLSNPEFYEEWKKSWIKE